ncbi:MAG: alpha/beta fold hydrolase [Acidimicrobiales bacterium]
MAASDGIELAVDVWLLPAGDIRRPGFVLIHGLASNKRMYDGVAPRLTAAGRPTAAIDLRGHGRSDKPDGGYDYDTMCADVAAVLRGLLRDPGAAYFARPVVVGQSFGGNLALELASRYPDLVAGVGCIDGGTIDLGSRFSSWEEARRALAPPKIEGSEYAELERRITQMHSDWPQTGIEGSLENFEVRSDGTVAPWLSFDHHMKILRSMWESPAPALYPKVKVPVLLMPADSPDAPADSSSSKHEGTDQALAALERAQVHWFTPADHDVHAQHPDKVAEVLLEAADSLFS